MADQKARRWKLAALLRARMEKVQARKEWMRFFAQRSLENDVETMATKAEAHSTRVDDVSILRSHAHRSKISASATAALECRNAC